MTVAGLLTLTWIFSPDFDAPLLEPKQEKRVVRGAGNALATRLRKKARSGPKATGQLARSLKFRLRRSAPGEPVVGVVGPRGIRKDSDGHKDRAPMSNFAVACFASAIGRDPLGMTDDDEAFYIAQVQRRIEEELSR